MVDTIESCQQEIMRLVKSTQLENAAPDYVPDVAAVSNDIARLYVRMADIFLGGRDIDSAAKCLETALHLDPQPWTEREGLERTKLFLEEMLARDPGNADLLGQLGELHYKLGEKEKALACFRGVLAVVPDDIRSLYMMPIVHGALGDAKAAEESLIRAVKLQPIFKIPAQKIPPDFSVLVVSAPLLGNTPITDMMQGSVYDINIFSLLSGEAYDTGLLKQKGSVVMNAVSEADSSSIILSQVEKLVDELDMPVINHPASIQRTSRDNIARLLKDILDCRVAQIVRHDSGEAADIAKLKKKVSFLPPFLARPAGTHGGEKFEKFGSLEALSAFLREEPGSDHYIMDYVDYQSPDGHFRKYRFFFVDEQILPYHLAIGNDWKVHHATTDMDKNEWMQAEERAFLENPERVFLPKHYQALRAIKQAIGLEYFGIDCGIDKTGNLVVFEANATMLVHWHNEAFPYKTPFVDNIKRAFDTMLRKRAGL